MREGERKKAERCLVDIHREDYEVMQRWLQSSPMLHTSIESPSHPSLQTPLATTIKLSALPLHVKFSLFFSSPRLLGTTGRLARSQLSCEEPHVVTAPAKRARTCVFGRIGFPLCRHRAPFDRSRDWPLGAGGDLSEARRRKGVALH